MTGKTQTDQVILGFSKQVSRWKRDTTLVEILAAAALASPQVLLPPFFLHSRQTDSGRRSTSAAIDANQAFRSFLGATLMDIDA
jgi:hypothetical protein